MLIILFLSHFLKFRDLGLWWLESIVHAFGKVIQQSREMRAERRAEILEKTQARSGGLGCCQTPDSRPTGLNCLFFWIWILDRFFTFSFSYDSMIQCHIIRNQESESIFFNIDDGRVMWIWVVHTLVQEVAAESDQRKGSCPQLSVLARSNMHSYDRTATPTPTPIPWWFRFRWWLIIFYFSKLFQIQIQLDST